LPIALPRRRRVSRRLVRNDALKIGSLGQALLFVHERLAGFSRQRLRRLDVAKVDALAIPLRSRQACGY